MGEATRIIRVARAVVTAILLVALFAPAGRGLANGSEPGSASGLSELFSIVYFGSALTFGLVGIVVGAIALSWVVVVICPKARFTLPVYRIGLTILCPLAVFALVRAVGREPTGDPLSTTWGTPLLFVAILLAGAVELTAYLTAREAPDDDDEGGTAGPPRHARLWISWVVVTVLAIGLGFVLGHALGFLAVAEPDADPSISSVVDRGQILWRRVDGIVFLGGGRGASAYFCALGAFVGLLQCLLVLRRIRRAELRISGGALGFAGVLGLSLDLKVPLLGLLVCAAVSLLVGGVLFRLRDRLLGSRAICAGLLVLAGPAVLVLAVWAMDVLPLGHALATARPALGLALWGAVFGLVYGAITGTALVPGLRLRAAS